MDLIGKSLQMVWRDGAPLRMTWEPLIMQLGMEGLLPQSA